MVEDIVDFDRVPPSSHQKDDSGSDDDLDLSEEEDSKDSPNTSSRPMLTGNSAIKQPAYKKYKRKKTMKGTKKKQQTNPSKLTKGSTIDDDIGSANLTSTSRITRELSQV